MTELKENKKTLEEESEKYKTMAQNFKDKQDHYTKQLNDLSAKQ